MKTIFLMTLLLAFEVKAQTLTERQAMESQLDYHRVRDAWKIASPVAGRLFIRKGQDVTVAVVDTGVASFHPLISSNLRYNTGEAKKWPSPSNDGIDNDNNGFIDDLLGWDFVFQAPVTDDPAGHGTHVAGIIAANSDLGVAPLAKIIPIRVLNMQGTGSLSQILEGIQYAVEQYGTRVINLSLGVVDPERVTASYYETLAKEAEKRNILLVIAAGNNNSNNDLLPVYPANLNRPNVITVCSVTNQGFLSDFSNYGKESVDLCALGSDVTSLNNSFYNESGLTRVDSGTSMAAPFVSGVAALIFSFNPNLKASQVKDIIVQSARRETFSLGGQNYYKLNGVSRTNSVLDATAALNRARSY